MGLENTNEKMGSIGAIWPPYYDSHNKRIKGFYPVLVNNIHQLISMFEEVRKVEEQYNEATRTTFRVFAKKEVLTEEIIKEPVAGQYCIEARIDARNVLPGYVIVYFGRNAEERMPDDETLKKEKDSVERILNTIAPISIEEARGKLEKNYIISIVWSNVQKREDINIAELTDIDIDRLLELYHQAYERYTFDINETAIREMFSNGNIGMVCRNSKSEIVSCLIAEHDEIRLEQGPPVHLYELSDAATFREHRGKGLITAMKMVAVDIIKNLHHGDAIIYGEARAAWKAVNISTRKVGGEYCGILPQHCVLVSDRNFDEKGIYENLNVWGFG